MTTANTNSRKCPRCGAIAVDHTANESTEIPCPKCGVLVLSGGRWRHADGAWAPPKSFEPGGQSPMAHPGSAPVVVVVATKPAALVLVGLALVAASILAASFILASSMRSQVGRYQRGFAGRIEVIDTTTGELWIRDDSGSARSLGTPQDPRHLYPK